MQLYLTALDEQVKLPDDKSWTGYDQDGEDANQDIRCPICGKNPFQNDEIQIFNIVRVVKFKKAK